jgi:hypothetical protein
MLDQTRPSRSWTPLPQKRRHGGPPERPANRVVGAAIVAGGLPTYGLPDVVRSLQLLDSLGPVRHSFPGVSRGGSGGSSDVPEEVWPALMLLLDFLEQNPPSLSGGGGRWDVITNVFPK